MRKLSFSVLVLFLCSFSFAGSKLDRVWVMPGGSFNPAIFQGMLDAAEDLDQSPEAVVATCGVGFTLFLNKLIPDRQARHKYMRSTKFQNLMLDLLQRNPEFANVGSVAWAATGPALRYLFTSEKGTKNVPDIFNQFVFSLPQQGSIDWAKYLPEDVDPTIPSQTMTEEGIRYVSLSSRVLFAQSQVNTAWDKKTKLFKTVILTDSNTAALGDLESYQNLSAIAYPNSTIEKETDVFTDQPLWVAARANFSNPLLFDPFKIGSDYYINGSSDHYPIELGKRLLNKTGKLVVMLTPRMDMADEFILRQFYNFSVNEWRVKALLGAKGVHAWVNTLKKPDEHTFKYKREGTKLLNGVPTNYGVFLGKIEGQYKYGYDQAKKALQNK